MLSLDEGFGLPVLEAMAHGCPVVAADAAALPEVVHGAGVLVDPNRSDAVADAIREVVTNFALRAELIRKGLTRAAEFPWSATALKMRDVYTHALAPVESRGGTRSALKTEGTPRPYTEPSVSHPVHSDAAPIH
jgi:glycosyltransferase involved in cell wall biosynthesis